MKRVLIILAMLIILCFFIPYIVVECPILNATKKDSSIKEALEEISVYIKDEDKVVTMNMSQYLKETVAAEMPAEFEVEALKAQAVAARTYLLNRKNNKKTNDDAHKGADICTDYAHCKAWISQEERMNSWGDKSHEYWKKISDAVEETADVIITYNGKPISAVFHSTSSGFTESAVDVWGSNVSYLVSVKSDGEEASPRYRSSVSMSTAEFKEKIEPHISSPDWKKGLFKNINRSEAGGIKSIEIAGCEISGVKFREIFGLRSTNISIHEENNNIYMEILGYGHGVGMSQYGANHLAKQGMNYVDILKTYYTGVDVG